MQSTQEAIHGFLSRLQTDCAQTSGEDDEASTSLHGELVFFSFFLFSRYIKFVFLCIQPDSLPAGSLWLLYLYDYFF